MHEIKNVILLDDEYFSTSDSVDANFIFTDGYWTLTSGWQMTYDNYAVADGAGIGDSPMDDGCMETDGNLVITLGWADGFSIKRVNDDGTFLDVFTDAGPAGYSGGQSMGIDKTNKVVVVGSYNTTVAEVYDYSDTSSIAGVTKGTGDGFNVTPQFGSSYFNGLAMAGTWLYLGDENATSVMRRWNHVTELSDDLTVVNIDLSGYRGRCQYDEQRDWIMVSWQVNGELWLVQSASSDANATAHCINVEEVGFTDDCNTFGMIPLNDTTGDNLYKIYLFGDYGSHGLYEIGGVCTGSQTGPGVNYERHPQLGAYPIAELPFRWGTATSVVRHPVSGSDMLICCPDRGANFSGWGWFDTENWMPVRNSNRYSAPWFHDLPSITGKTMPYSPTANTALSFDYGPAPRLATSGNGTDYWIAAGYGSNGHLHRSWLRSTAEFLLVETATAVFDGIQLDNLGNIGTFQFTNMSQSMYVPSDCSTTIQVSNDDGTTWENYDWTSTELHHFTSVGDSVSVKIILTGPGTKSPYYFDIEPPALTIREKDYYESTNFAGRARNKIKGI